MNIHEYQAKGVLRDFGVPVPRGIPAFSADEAVKAANDLGEEYGIDRFAKRVLDGIHMPAKELIDHVRKGVSDFTERKFLDDDGTLFVVKAL